MATATLSSLSPTVPAVTTTTATVITPNGTAMPVTKGSLVGGAVGAAILGFIVIFSFIWIILFSFRPSFVRRIEKGETKACEDAPADPARCFVASLIITLLIVIIIWMFSACR